MRSDQKSRKEILKPIISVFLVGVAGISIPPLRGLFLGLTFFILIAGFLLLLLNDGNGRRGQIFFISVIILTFFLEVAGVKSGQIFGVYAYGDNLGPKLLETPLIIGFNWAILAYSSSTIARGVIGSVLPATGRTVAKISVVFTASLIMVLIDIILERVAPLAGFWSWQDGIVPVRNYVAWFVSAIIINSGIVLFEIDTKNRVAVPLILAMTLFLTITYMILILYP